MVEVRPFQGWRYDVAQVGDLADVTAPPYDVITPNQQAELYEKHPCNVIRLILNRQEPGDESNEDRYSRAADFLRHWQSEGVLLQEHEDAFYVYHQEFDWEGTHYVRKGFLGRIRLEEFGKGQVYPHEKTMSGPKADRLMLTKACQMNLSPIFGLYPDPDQAAQSPLEEAILNITPLVVKDHLGVTHRLWPISDEDVLNEVSTALLDKPVFIADGHHRYETAVNYRNWLQSQGQLTSETHSANFVLMMFVGMSDPGLAILPTHRMVQGLPDLSSQELQEVLSSYLELQEMGTGPQAAHSTWEMMQADGGQEVFGFGTTDGKWLFGRITDDSPMATQSPEMSENWRKLGVSLLHRQILDYLLARKYPQADIQCKYVHLMEEVNEGLQHKDFQLACLVAPANIHHVQDIASRFEKMPPKSTFFYPKLLSGLVFHSLK